MGSDNNLFTKGGFYHFFDLIYIAVRTVALLVCNHDAFADEHGIILFHTLYPFVKQLYLRDYEAGTATATNESNDVNLVEFLEFAFSLSCSRKASLTTDAISISAVFTTQNDSFHHFDHP